MGFKDLALLKKKEYLVFTVLLFWMLIGHFANIFIPLNIFFVFLPFLTYASFIFALSAFQNKNILQMSFAEHIKAFMISLVLGLVPLLILKINLILFLITIFIIFGGFLILYLSVPSFQKRDLFFYSLWFIIWIGFVLVSFIFILLFIPLMILNKVHQKAEKNDLKILNYRYSTTLQFSEFFGGSTLAFIILSIAYLTSVTLINTYGEVEFDLPGMLEGMIGFMSFVLFMGICFLFFGILNSWLGVFNIIVGVYSFYLMVKAYYKLSISTGIIGLLIPNLASIQFLIDIGLLIINLLFFFYVMGAISGKMTAIVGEKLKSWKTETVLIWLILSNGTDEFVHIVAGLEIIGVKEGVELALFLLVGFVAIQGMISSYKKQQKGKFFKSRKSTILFIILVFIAFGGFTTINNFIISFFPILGPSEIPILSPSFIFLFILFGFIAILFFYKNRNKLKLNDNMQ
jgi:hypothetical protein